MTAAARRSEKGRHLRERQRAAHPLHLAASRGDRSNQRQARSTDVYSRNGQLHQRHHHAGATAKVDGEKRWMIGVTLEPRLEIVKLPSPASAGGIVPSECSESAADLQSSSKELWSGGCRPRLDRRPIRIAQMSGEAAREGPGNVYRLDGRRSVSIWRSSTCCRFRFWTAA